MGPRLKKAIGMLAILVFLTLYAMGAVSLHGLLPKNFLLELVYFAIAGTAWGLPLFPLLTWMNKEPKGPRP
ncbi:MAG TPA: DUF2842 domain-containing protein [Caulobacter sp.]|nr:DUF2842 domain-containing protein [Caulobacter sp.]